MDEDNIIEEDTGEQPISKHRNKAEHLKEWQYKKGQSGNPAGRAKGISLKEYTKMKFSTMNDDEREDFLNGLNKDTIWEMGEGKPESKVENSGITKVLLIDKELADLYGIRTTPETDGSSQEPSKVQGS